MDKTKNTNGWWDKHKGQVCFVAGVAVTIACGAVAVCLKNRPEPDQVKMPGFSIKGGLTVGDLGKLGEEYMKHDPMLTKDTPVLKVGEMKFN